jgi:uncharacterized iron-regulated membrane protein
VTGPELVGLLAGLTVITAAVLGWIGWDLRRTVHRVETATETALAARCAAAAEQAELQLMADAIASGLIYPGEDTP